MFLAFFMKNIGKIVAVSLLAMWIFATWWLYNETIDLNVAVAQRDVALVVCQDQRDVMDERLIDLKSDIVLIQAQNEKYKDDIISANINIGVLENEIIDRTDTLEQEIVPEECEGAMEWMKEKALER